MTVKRVLLYLLCTHMVVLFLQLPLRATIFDTTYTRDGFMVLAVLLWGLGTLMSPPRFRIRRLDAAVGILFAYGALRTAIGVAGGGDVAANVLDFRNYFLPLVLYFPARSAFESTRHRTTFMSLAVVLLAGFLAVTLFEYLYSLTSLPMSWIPWYRYAFQHDPRFIGNSDTAYILPEDTPLLGPLGFPHYSAPALVALFAFVQPSLGIQQKAFKQKHEAGPLNVLSRIPHGIYAILFGLAILLFGVRTHIVTALVVLVVLPSGAKALRILTYATAVALVIVFVMPDQVSAAMDRFATGFANDRADQTSFGLILMSFRDLAFILSGTPLQLLFGHGVGFDASGGQWEVKILYFTAAFGLLWLVLFGALILILVRTILATRQNYPRTSLEARVAQGCLGMTFVYLLDAGHYMRMMNWPNLDFWIISLALLASAIASRVRTPIRQHSAANGSALIADIQASSSLALTPYQCKQF